jgi:hypothetical protein
MRMEGSKRDSNDLQCPQQSPLRSLYEVGVTSHTRCIQSESHILRDLLFSGLAERDVVQNKRMQARFVTQRPGIAASWTRFSELWRSINTTGLQAPAEQPLEAGSYCMSPDEADAAEVRCPTPQGAPSI